MTDAQEDMLKAIKDLGRVTVPMMVRFHKNTFQHGSRHKMRGLLERLTRDGHLIKETEKGKPTNHTTTYYRLKS